MRQNWYRRNRTGCDQISKLGRRSKKKSNVEIYYTIHRIGKMLIV